MIKKGYVIMVVLAVITLLTSALSMTMLYISYHFNHVNKELRQVDAADALFKRLDEVTDFIKEKKKEEYTSAFSGWYLSLKQNFPDVEIIPEDDKIAVNLMTDASLKRFFQEKKIKLKTGEIIYDLTDDLVANDVSIYMLPNVNTADLGKMGLFFEQLDYALHDPSALTGRIGSYRGGKSYLEYRGLIIKESEFEFLRSYFLRGREDFLNVFADYSGTVNLNFVNKTVFDYYYHLAAGSKDKKMEIYWARVVSRQASQSTIQRIEEIFQGDTRFTKFFSTDSFLFTIKIKEKETELVAVVRFYENRKGVLERYILMSKVKGEGQWGMKKSKS